MASVKWLTRIQAVREPFRGYWQTSDYGYWDDLDGKPVRRALGEMKLKSEIARPRVYETLAPNQRYTVFGAASGTVFIAVGVAVNLSSARRHPRVVEELNRGQLADLRRPSQQAVVLALFLALVGVAMALYLALA